MKLHYTCSSTLYKASCRTSNTGWNTSWKRMMTIKRALYKKLWKKLHLSTAQKILRSLPVFGLGCSLRSSLRRQALTWIALRTWCLICGSCLLLMLRLLRCRCLSLSGQNSSRTWRVTRWLFWRTTWWVNWKSSFHLGSRKMTRDLQHTSFGFSSNSSRIRRSRTSLAWLRQWS